MAINSPISLDRSAGAWLFRWFFDNKQLQIHITMRKAIGVLSCLFAALVCQEGLAAVVTTTADGGAGSLRAAIAGAVAGETITFAVTGTIALTSGELLINKNLIVSGPGAGSLTV